MREIVSNYGDASATNQLSVIVQIMRGLVSPLQGLVIGGMITRAFGPGYHMAGLRPFEFGGMITREVTNGSKPVISPSIRL
jgi:hypothetical protein